VSLALLPMISGGRDRPGRVRGLRFVVLGLRLVVWLMDDCRTGNRRVVGIQATAARNLWGTHWWPSPGAWFRLGGRGQHFEGTLVGVGGL
jgi:hypothetical protein